MSCQINICMTTKVPIEITVLKLLHTLKITQIHSFYEKIKKNHRNKHKDIFLPINLHPPAHTQTLYSANQTNYTDSAHQR